MAVPGGVNAGVYPILGTMTFGTQGQVKLDAAGVILRTFCGASCTKAPSVSLIDTARIYQHATPDGDTETTIGDAYMESPSLKKGFALATKANSMMAPHYSLSKQSVIEQCDTSLEKLGLDCVALFYLHFPDIKTDINDTLDGIDELHKAGKIKEFGLSNYPAWAVVDIWHRCKNRGMVLPTVYQGMYNVITRDMEREIVPVARQFGMRLYMYNPLAGGLLTGRYSKVEDLAKVTEGRFSSEFDRGHGEKVKAAEIYRKRYSNDQIFAAIEILQKVCAPKVQETAAESPQEPGLPMAEVALRWLIHHSYLAKGDGIILGVSKQTQLSANLEAWHAGPLPDHIVEACNAAWEAARPACEPYFRGYGAVPGSIDGFLAMKAEEEQKNAK